LNTRRLIFVKQFTSEVNMGSPGEIKINGDHIYRISRGCLRLHLCAYTVCTDGLIFKYNVRLKLCIQRKSKWANTQ
jgi:hypothetical protein